MSIEARFDTDEEQGDDRGAPRRTLRLGVSGKFAGGQSGTATVQTALHDKPMVVVYRLSGLTYRLGRAFVRVPHYAMVNLIAVFLLSGVAI